MDSEKEVINSFILNFYSTKRNVRGQWISMDHTCEHGHNWKVSDSPLVGQSAKASFEDNKERGQWNTEIPSRNIGLLLGPYECAAAQSMDSSAANNKALSYS